MYASSLRPGDDIMKPFTEHTGIVIPLDRTDVDTDAIIPKQYLKSIEREGFGANLFDSWRYLDPGELGQDHSRRRINPDFVFNDPRYRHGEILLTRSNFGCGSSREHAVWALRDFGIRAIIAESYADIFFSNACRNGLPAVALPAADVERLLALVLAGQIDRLTVDLRQQQVVLPAGDAMPFTMPADARERLLGGLDDIALSLQQADRIRAYEEQRRREVPWLFADTDKPADHDVA